VLVEGRSYDETAAALDISVASVGKRLNRVRARIRERFGDDR
jgi:DNA-directed RNA polymerase specialized sigma24 family protein